MTRLRLRSVSILVAAALLMLPIFAFADSPAGTPSGKVDKTTKNMLPPGVVVPAGATITGWTSTGLIVAGTVVVVGGGLTGLGIALSEEGGDDVKTNPGAAAHH